MRSSRTDDYSRALQATGDENVFNPSVAIEGGVEHLAYRAYGPSRSKPFHAIHLTRDSSGGQWRRCDLTQHASTYGVPNVADPKLVVLDGRVFVTFNNGYSETRNEIYLMQVAPTLGPPQLCEVDARQQVEKNWGFFSNADGVFAIYALAPLIVLRLDVGELGEGPLHFAPAEMSPPPSPPVGLTLGTQPVGLGEDLLLVAHEKHWIRGRCFYFGRAVRIRDVLGVAHVAVSARKLVHSFAALRPPPRSRRHNPDLLFATYFSGFAVHEGGAFLGYGVNDEGWGFAEVGVDALW